VAFSSIGPTPLPLYEKPVSSSYGRRIPRCKRLSATTTCFVPMNSGPKFGYLAEMATPRPRRLSPSGLRLDGRRSDLLQSSSLTLNSIWERPLSKGMPLFMRQRASRLRALGALTCSLSTATSVNSSRRLSKFPSTYALPSRPVSNIQKSSLSPLQQRKVNIMQFEKHLSVPPAAC